MTWTWLNGLREAAHDWSTAPKASPSLISWWESSEKALTKDWAFTYRKKHGVAFILCECDRINLSSISLVESILINALQPWKVLSFFWTTPQPETGHFHVEIGDLWRCRFVHRCTFRNISVGPFYTGTCCLFSHFPFRGEVRDSDLTPSNVSAATLQVHTRFRSAKTSSQVSISPRQFWKVMWFLPSCCFWSNRSLGKIKAFPSTFPWQLGYARTKNVP